MLDFLRLNDVAPHAFEKSKAVKELAGGEVADVRSFSNLVQDYRNEILGAIDSMMNYDKDMLTNEIPPEFNRALQEHNSPSRVARMMMGLAFGGIDE